MQAGFFITAYVLYWVNIACCAKSEKQTPFLPKKSIVGIQCYSTIEPVKTIQDQLQLSAYWHPESKVMYVKDSTALLSCLDFKDFTALFSCLDFKDLVRFSSI